MPRDRGVRHASRKRGLQLLDRGGAARAVGRRRGGDDASVVAGLDEGREPAGARGLGTAGAGSVSSATTGGGYTAEVLSVLGTTEMATRRGVGSVFRPVRKAGINPDAQSKNIGVGDVIGRTSTLVAEEPATRRPGTRVVTRVRVLSAGSVDRSTRLIGVKGSGRTRSRATFRVCDARKVSVASTVACVTDAVFLVHPFCKISTPEIPGLIAFDQNRPTGASDLGPRRR